MNVRRTAAAYFALQGIAVLLWWALLLAVPSSRAYFRLDPNSDTSLLAFWLPDLALLATGSLVASLLIMHSHRMAESAMWFVSGTICYACCYVIAYALLAGTGWLGVTFMVPAAILSVISTGACCRFDLLVFRQARPATRSWIVAKAFLQTTVFWGVLLFLAPYLITRIETQLGIVPFGSPLLRLVASIAFIAFGTLGLWSSFIMASIGEGTPMPIDSARRLVICGPYSYVRNPMAIAGLGQGFIVGLWWGSPLVILYAFTGLVVWQLIARPLEEEDMARNFGEEFEEYRRQVRCWWPRRTPFKSRLVDNEHSNRRVAN